MVLTPVDYGKIVGTLIMGAVIFFSYQTVKGWHDDAIEFKAKYETANQALMATQGVATAFSTALDAERGQEETVATARVVAESQFEDLKRAHPDTVGDWADSAIPLELREAERARRLARDRPGAGEARGEASDREASDRGDDSAQR